MLFCTNFCLCAVSEVRSRAVEIEERDRDRGDVGTAVGAYRWLSLQVFKIGHVLVTAACLFVFPEVFNIDERHNDPLHFFLHTSAVTGIKFYTGQAHDQINTIGRVA